MSMKARFEFRLVFCCCMRERQRLWWSPVMLRLKGTSCFVSYTRCRATCRHSEDDHLRSKRLVNRRQRTRILSQWCLTYAERKVKAQEGGLDNLLFYVLRIVNSSKDDPR
jgi:hypothetical protein